MKKMKSKKLKRLCLGLSVATAMSIFTAFPALAAENCDNTSDVAVTQDVTNDSSQKLVYDSVEKSFYNDISTLSDVGLYAGTETWYGGSAFAGEYTFTNNNTTPVKIMGQSGTLLISGNFYGADGYASASPIKLTVEIRSATTNAVLGRTIAVDSLSGATPFAVSCNVSQGQKIQLFFDASSVANPPGIYRKAHVSYNRYLY